MNLATVEAKAFVPAADFAVSKAFYLALGFEIPWSDDALAYVRYGGVSFLLQSFDAPGFATRFQMHLLVENVDDWHAHVCAVDLPGRFAITPGPLTDQPWGMREFFLKDPAGVLWRIAQNTPARVE